uniref:Tryptophyllin-14 n=1 Tax=Pithecopus centralis TaxID=536631 RepID=TY14_PITCE|nr:RecName: Full=Tryptophyllin-14 [Pithecopus centralis]
FPPWVL